MERARPILRSLVHRPSPVLRRPLLTFAILAFALRALLFATLDRDPLQDAPRSDAALYHSWAASWAGGEPFPGEPDGQPFWRSPGYPSLLSLLYRLTGPHPHAAILVQMLLGWITSLLVVSAAGKRWGNRAAWIATALLLLQPALLFFETQLLPVSLATALLTIAGLRLFGLLDFAHGEPRHREPLLIGLLLGLLAVVRSNLLLVLPIVFLRLLLGGRRSAATILLLAAALPLLGNLGWNLARSGQPVLLGANGGLNFHFAWHDRATATFALPASLPHSDEPGTVWGSPGDQRKVALRVASEITQRPTRDAEASRVFFRCGTDWILANPGAALRLSCRKLVGLLSLADLSVVASPQVSQERLWPLRVVSLLGLDRLTSWAALLLLALLASLGGSSRSLDAILIAAAPVALGVVLFFSYTRFRIPAIPLLALAAAGIAPHLGSLVRRRVRLLGAIATTALLATAALWPLPEADLSSSNAWWNAGDAWRSRYETAPAGSPARVGLLDSAESCYRKADLMEPRNPKGRWGLAHLDFLRRRFPEARQQFEQLVRDFPEFHPVRTDLATMLEHGLGGPTDPVRAAALRE